MEWDVATLWQLRGLLGKYSVHVAVIRRLRGAYWEVAIRIPLNYHVQLPRNCHVGTPRTCHVDPVTVTR